MKNEVKVQGQLMHCYPVFLNDPWRILRAIMDERRCTFCTIT